MIFMKKELILIVGYSNPYKMCVNSDNATYGNLEPTDGQSVRNYFYSYFKPINSF
jgi:hypothetical protein